MKLTHTAVAVSLALAFSAGAITPCPASGLTRDADAPGIATDPVLHRAFVADRAGASVAILGLDDMAPLGAVWAGGNPIAMVGDAASGRLYVLNDGTPGNVAVIDAASGALLSRIDVGDSPRDLAADLPRAELYVANAGSATVSIIDAKAGTVAATLAVGNAPSGIGVDSVRNRIYVANEQDGSVSMIDAASRLVLGTTAVGRVPRLPLVDERSGRVYVNNAGDHTVSVLDADSGSIVAQLPTGGGSTVGTLSPVYRKYYLPNADDGTVTVIDLDTQSIDTVAVGDAPQDVSIDADAGTAYVANRMDGTVSVLDAGSDQVVNRLATGTRPMQVAIPSTEDRILVADDGAAGLAGVGTIAKVDLAPQTAIAAEYYDADGDHYFHTAAPIEKRLLSDGLYGTQWLDTGQYWRVWTLPGPDRVPVCRFLATGFANSSHVYTPYGKECVSLKSKGPWQFESIAYFVALPDANGACADGLAPLYRLYNDGQGGAPNHRFTADAGIRDLMQAKGWIAEGTGSGHVFACTPPLIAAQVAVPPGRAHPPVNWSRIPLLPHPSTAGSADTDQPPPSNYVRIAPIRRPL
jgi:YVTN family beta-propeller protein